MLVYIKHIAGKVTECEVKPSHTIYNLKQIIENKEGIDPENQRLVFKNKALDDLSDDKELSEYNICNGNVLHLIIRLRGGGGPVGGEFQDMSKPTTKLPWGNNSPSWRKAVNGLNLEGKI